MANTVQSPLTLIMNIKSPADYQQLNGLLPICSYCKKIRDDRNYWQQVEGYISKHSEVQFSHGICPDCYERVVLPELERRRSPPETAGP